MRLVRRASSIVEYMSLLLAVTYAAPASSVYAASAPVVEHFFQSLLEAMSLQGQLCALAFQRRQCMLHERFS